MRLTRLQTLRHYRRRRALRNAMLLRELQRGWVGRFAVWLYARKVRAAMNVRAQQINDLQELAQ